MTNRKQQLTYLLEMVEAGSAHPYSFHSFFDTPCAKYATNAYHGSLDAAKELHEAVLPGWDYAIYVPEGFQPEVQLETETMRSLGDFEPLSGLADNPARAWLIAILKALIAWED